MFYYRSSSRLLWTLSQISSGILGAGIRHYNTERQEQMRYPLSVCLFWIKICLNIGALTSTCAPFWCPSAWFLAAAPGCSLRYHNRVRGLCEWFPAPLISGPQWSNSWRSSLNGFLTQLYDCTVNCSFRGRPHPHSFENPKTDTLPVSDGTTSGKFTPSIFNFSLICIDHVSFQLPTWWRRRTSCTCACACL